MVTNNRLNSRRGRDLIMKKYTKKTKFIVFVTTNTANHKIYVGIHATEEPSKFDGYVGQTNDFTPNTGRAALSRDIKKFGIDKFHRLDLAIFDTMEEAQTLYNNVVTEDFVHRKTVYNNRYQEGTIPSKKVIQYTLDGKFVKIWESQEHVLKYFNKKSKKILQKCLDGKRNVYLNHQWRYWSDDYPLVIGASPLLELPVHQYSEDGLLMKTHKTALKAANSVGGYSSGVRSATQTRKLYYGYQWRYFIGDPPVSIPKYISPKAVLQIDRETGNVIKTWPDLETVRQHGFKITAQMIPQNGKAKEFGWIYKKNEDKIMR